ncbi:uncharacterized protein LOC105202336 [Solenopsis invicta]|uniref:uncharacterized protein LOC105202336 n=1 Tax=Solenopsis invicta TaxID=13686 RepID=UPI0001FEBAD1|nr:uncharacterized protein LOC105202336 [Solenopsis invicta]
MARSHIVSAIFLTFFSASMIQGAVITQERILPQLLHPQAFPNLVNAANIPRFGELYHNTAASAANTLSTAANGFRTHFDDFRTGLRDYITVPPQYGALHRFVHGDVWPNFENRVVSAPGRVAPGFLGNYGGNGGAASAASAAAASPGV